MTKKKDAEAEAEDFEAIVAALLQVDPEGITGQTSKDAKAKKKADDDVS